MKFRSTIWIAAAMGLMVAGLISAASNPQKPSAEQKVKVKKEGILPPPKGNPLKGKAVFEEQCEICHYTASNEKKIGPGLKGIFRYGKFSDGKKVDDKSMRAWIENGGKDMPSFKESLNPDQIDNLIAFLRTL
jgi:cytochrome c2